LEIYERAVSQHPGSERAFLALGILQLTVKDTTAAINTFQDALVKKSAFHRLRGSLRDLYVQQRRWDDAIALYEPLKDNDTTFVGSRLEIAHLFLEKGDTLQAIALVQPLLADHPDDWRIPVTLGRFHFIKNELPQAVQYFNQAVELRDDLIQIWMLRGLAYMRMDSLDTAENIFEQAEKKFTRDPEIPYYLGVIANQQKKFSRAVAWFNKALEIDPSNDQTALALAGAFDELRQYDNAENLYAKLLESNPDSPIILNNYAYHLSVQAKDLDRALEMSQKAVTAAPGNAPYLDTLGWIYFQKGEYEKAKNYIEQAMELSPNTAEVIEHLGDVYEKLGDLAMAEQLWRKAYELDDRRMRLLEKLGQTGK